MLSPHRHWLKPFKENPQLQVHSGFASSPFLVEGSIKTLMRATSPLYSVLVP